MNSPGPTSPRKCPLNIPCLRAHGPRQTPSGSSIAPVRYHHVCTTEGARSSWPIESTSCRWRACSREGLKRDGRGECGGERRAEEWSIPACAGEAASGRGGRERRAGRPGNVELSPSVAESAALPRACCAWRSQCRGYICVIGQFLHRACCPPDPFHVCFLKVPASLSRATRLPISLRVTVSSFLSFHQASQAAVDRQGCDPPPRAIVVCTVPAPRPAAEATDTCRAGPARRCQPKPCPSPRPGTEPTPEPRRIGPSRAESAESKPGQKARPAEPEPEPGHPRPPPLSQKSWTERHSRPASRLETRSAAGTASLIRPAPRSTGTCSRGAR